MTKIYTNEEVYNLLFTKEQAALICRLLEVDANKKISKKKEREDKKAAKDAIKANKTVRIKKVKTC
jgi:hypothetical protein